MPSVVSKPEAIQGFKGMKVITCTIKQRWVTPVLEKPGV